MKAKHVITTGLALAMVVAISSQSGARMWGNNHGPMMNGQMMNGQMMNGQMMNCQMTNGQMMNGQMMNNGMMGGNGHNMPALTTEQQAAVDTIEAKYQTPLAEKETAIRNKATEINTAQTDDATTFGQIKTLNSELYTLKQDYWTLRNTVKQEIGGKIGTTFYGDMGWGSDNCAWHDNNHQGMLGRTAYMNNQRGSMMRNGSTCCNW